MRAPRLIVGTALASVMLLGACAESTTKAAAPSGAALTTVSTTAPPTSAPTVMALTEETFVDKTRPTAANGSYPGAPDRTLRVPIFYPERDGEPALDRAPYPLVVVSHGNDGLPEGMTPIIAALVKRGYVVVAPEFPLSNLRAPGGPTLADVPNQPGDVSFVLDRVLEDAKDAGSVLHDMIDDTRVGAVGHSLGAITTYGLVYNTCCHDERIKALVPIAGAAVGMPGGEFFTGPHPPLLAIHGVDDDTVSYKAGKDAWDKAPAPKYLIRVSGEHGDHGVGMYQPSQWLDDYSEMIADFFDATLRDQPEKLDAVKQFGSQPGITTFLSEP
jgi:dienelactone hydrolase